MGIVVGILWVADGESDQVCHCDTLDMLPTALSVSQRHKCLQMQTAVGEARFVVDRHRLDRCGRAVGLKHGRRPFSEVDREDGILHNSYESAKIHTEMEIDNDE